MRILPQKRNINLRIYNFNRKFSEMYGSIICKDLLGCDLSTLEGSAVAREKKLFTTLCPKFVRDAVEIVEGLNNK